MKALSHEEMRALFAQMLKEDRITLKQVTSIPPRPSLSTVRKWIVKGLICYPATPRDDGLVRLESFKLGGVRYTTRQAVDRFYERIAMSDLREVDDHAPEVF